MKQRNFFNLRRSIGTYIVSIFVIVVGLVESHPTGAQDTTSDLLAQCKGQKRERECIGYLVIQNPGDVAIAKHYIGLLIIDQDFDLALSETRRIQEVEPENPDLFSLEAQILRLIGDDVQAENSEIRASFLREEEWMQLIHDPEVDPVDLVRAAYRADIVWNEPIIAKKLYAKHFEICTEPRPRDLRRYASLLAALGEYDSALSNMEKALQCLDQDDFETRAYLLKHRAGIRKAAGDLAGMESDEAEYKRIVSRIKMSQ